MLHSQLIWGTLEGKVVAGKIVLGGPYESVDDVLSLDLTDRQKELFDKYRENFTVTEPSIALNEGFDRINDGQYR